MTTWNPNTKEKDPLSSHGKFSLENPPSPFPELKFILDNIHK